MSFEAEFTEITISSGWGEPRALPLSLATSANILTPCSTGTRSITEWIPPSRGIRLCGRSAGSISQEIRRLFIGRSFIRRRDFPIGVARTAMLTAKPAVSNSPIACPENAEGYHARRHCLRRNRRHPGWDNKQLNIQEQLVAWHCHSQRAPFFMGHFC